MLLGAEAKNGAAQPGKSTFSEKKTPSCVILTFVIETWFSVRIEKKVLI
jgi:hypothetical protein